jgi:hypothetical protein
MSIHDDNFTGVLMGESSTTPGVAVPVQINPVTGSVIIEVASTATTVPAAIGENAISDDNFVKVGLAQDSTDPTKTVPMFATSNGYLLIST